MKHCFSLLLAVILCLAWYPVSAEVNGLTADDYSPLYELAEPYGFKAGICLSYDQLKDQAYLDFLTRHFNSTTCTNETKAYSLLDQRASRTSPDGMPRMNYSRADAMISWAQKNGVSVRGHVLVWDAYMTSWFFHEGYNDAKPVADRETIRTRVKSYIEQVITHFEEKFPGVIYCWDVVNEAIGDNNGEFRADDPRHIRTVRSGASNPFLDYVGDDYVEYAFLCAKDTVEALGADIRLFYNDYNMFYDGKRLPACKLIESINSYSKDKNGSYRKLIDGIGMQGYVGGYGVQSGCMNQNDIRLINKAIQTYASYGLEVQITEMAVRNFDKSQAEQHAAFYSELFETFKAANAGSSSPLTGVTIWGVNDIPVKTNMNQYSWKLNSSFGGLLTEKNEIKTSFDAIWHTLKGE